MEPFVTGDSHRGSIEIILLKDAQKSGLFILIHVH